MGFPFTDPLGFDSLLLALFAIFLVSCKAGLVGVMAAGSDHDVVALIYEALLHNCCILSKAQGTRQERKRGRIAAIRDIFSYAKYLAGDQGHGGVVTRRSFCRSHKFPLAAAELTHRCERGPNNISRTLILAVIGAVAGIKSAGGQ